MVLMAVLIAVPGQHYAAPTGRRTPDPRARDQRRGRDGRPDQLGEPGFAVGCYNDDVATALLHAASLRQWRVPHDLALIGMDRTPLSRLTTPPLTTMEYDTSPVTAENVQAILRHLDKSDVEEPAPRCTSS